MTDYRRLVAVPREQLPGWLRAEFPDGVPPYWTAAMLDLAITDYPANTASLPVRLRVAAALLAATPTIRAVFAAEWHLKLARVAVQAGVADVPAALRPDAVARRALASFRLTPAEAVAAAARQRGDYVRVLSTDSPDVAAEISAATDERLVTIEYLLARLAWFADHVTDPTVAAKIQAWSAVRDQLPLGDDVARLTRARRPPPP